MTDTLDLEVDAVTGLEALLTASTTFSTRPPANAPSVETRIHYPWFSGGNVEEFRPFAIIEPGDQYVWEMIAGGESNELWPLVTLSLILADNDRFPGDLKASYRDFASWSGLVIADLAAASGASGNLSIVAMRRVGNPAFTSPKDAGSDVARYWSCRWLLRCGTVDVGGG